MKRYSFPILQKKQMKSGMPMLAVLALMRADLHISSQLLEIDY